MVGMLNRSNVEFFQNSKLRLKKKLKNLTRFSTFNEDANLSDVRMSYTPDVRTFIIGLRLCNFNKK